MDHIKKMLYV